MVFFDPQGMIILITSSLEFFGHNGHLKILIGCVWGKEGVERGGLYSIKSHLTLKKDTRNYYFQLNEPPLKSITSTLAYKVPLKKKKPYGLVSHS